jgi:hypothetical protein
VVCRRKTATRDDLGSSPSVALTSTRQTPLQRPEDAPEDGAPRQVLANKSVALKRDISFDGGPERHAEFFTGSIVTKSRSGFSPGSTSLYPTNTIMGSLQSLNALRIRATVSQVFRPGRSWMLWNDDEDRVNWGNLYRTDPESDF